MNFVIFVIFQLIMFDYYSFTLYFFIFFNIAVNKPLVAQGESLSHEVSIELSGYL